MLLLGWGVLRAAGGGGCGGESGEIQNSGTLGSPRPHSPSTSSFSNAAASQASSLLALLWQREPSWARQPSLCWGPWRPGSASFPLT